MHCFELSSGELCSANDLCQKPSSTALLFCASGAMQQPHEFCKLALSLARPPVPRHEVPCGVSAGGICCISVPVMLCCVLSMQEKRPSLCSCAVGERALAAMAAGRSPGQKPGHRRRTGQALHLPAHRRHGPPLTSPMAGTCAHQTINGGDSGNYPGRPAVGPNQSSSPSPSLSACSSFIGRACLPFRFLLEAK
jgi:hypothetical protein